MLNGKDMGNLNVTTTKKTATTKTPAKKAAAKAVTKKPAKKATKKEKKILLPIRLSPDADRLLRTSEKGYLIGNLTKRVIAALEATNLDTVRVTDRDRTPGSGKQDFAMTTIQLPPAVKKRLSDAAEARGTSMSVLIEAAICKFFKEKK